MDIETLRLYCLSLPHTSEDMAFGEDHLLFRVCDKIFGCYSFTRPEWFTVKCDADYAIELRDRYADIQPAWHWNKRYWNQIAMRGEVPDELILKLVRHSYDQAAAKLPRRVRDALFQD